MFARTTGKSEWLQPLSSAAGGGDDGDNGGEDDASLPTCSRKLQSTGFTFSPFIRLKLVNFSKHMWLQIPLDVPPTQGLPWENHESLPVVGAGGELRGVGLQHGQAQLEVGFDPVEEEAVDHAHGAVEGKDAEEQGEEPGEGDRGEGGEVGDVLGQLRQTLPDQLLEHRLVHLSSCRGGAVLFTLYILYSHTYCLYTNAISLYFVVFMSVTWQTNKESHLISSFSSPRLRFCFRLHLFVYNQNSEKLLNGLTPNLEVGCFTSQERSLLILVWIRITGLIQEFFLSLSLTVWDRKFHFSGDWYLWVWEFWCR